MTITIFAGTFLACNIPAFLLQMKYFVLYIKEVEGARDRGVNRGAIMEWYAHLLSHFFLTLFNAAVNPCLYLLRMPDFRRWLKVVAKDPGLLFTNERVLKRAETSSIWKIDPSMKRSCTNKSLTQAPSRSLTVRSLKNEAFSPRAQIPAVGGSRPTVINIKGDLKN